MTTHENSNLISTDHDLSKEIHMNDVIRIRTETFRVTGVVSPSQFVVEPPSRLGNDLHLQPATNYECMVLIIY